jgi:hypothetical protein
MKRLTHPDAYDWGIKIGFTSDELAGMFDSLVIGIYNAHADLRKAGKLPSSAILESSEFVAAESYDPSIITEEEKEMIEKIIESAKDSTSN